MRIAFIHPGLVALCAALALHILPFLPALPTAWPGLFWLALCGLLLVRRSRVLLWLSLCLVFVLLRAQGALEERLPVAAKEAFQTARLQVEGLPRRGDEGWSFQARWLDHPRSPRLDVFWSAGYGAHAGTNLPVHLMAGDELSAEIKLRSLASPRNSMTWGWADAELRALERGVAARASVKSATKIASSSSLSIDEARYFVRYRILQMLAQDHARASGILVGLVLGDQAAISNSDWEFFNRTGVGHLMSISGLHVTMFAFAGSGLAVLGIKALLRWRRFGQTYLVRTLIARVSIATLAAWIGLAFAGAYCLFSGAEIPAQRTVWMLLAMAVARSFLRASHSLTPIGFALVVVLAIDPWAVASPGFWLSFVATTVLFQLANAKTWWFAALKAQWMVTLGLLPLSALLFGGFAPLSLAANMFAIPTVSYLITPLAMLGALLSLSSFSVLAHCGSLALSAAAWSAEVLLGSLHFLEQGAPSWAQMQALAAPATSMGGLAIFAGGAAVVWVAFAPRFQQRPIAGGVTLLVALVPLFILPRIYTPTARGMTISAFDLGNASAIYVETPDLRLLYDTGSRSSTGRDSAKQTIIPWLAKKGIRNLDFLVLSHADREHSGGMESIQKALKIGAVFMPSCERKSKTLGQTRLEFYGVEPMQGSELGLRAATSRDVAHCIVSVHWGDDPRSSVLLLGDLSQKGQAQWLKLHEQVPRIGVLQMPGQGSAKAWAEGFLEALAPEYVLAQLKVNHWRSYPAPKATQPLEKQGASLLRTDTMGAVQLRFVHGPSSLDTLVYRERQDRPRYYD